MSYRTRDNALALIWGEEVTLQCLLKDPYGDVIDLRNVRNDKVTLKISQNNILQLELNPVKIDEKSYCTFIVLTSLLKIGTASGAVIIETPKGIRTSYLDLDIINLHRYKTFNPSVRGC